MNREKYKRLEWKELWLPTSLIATIPFLICVIIAFFFANSNFELAKGLVICPTIWVIFVFIISIYAHVDFVNEYGQEPNKTKKEKEEFKKKIPTWIVMGLIVLVVGYFLIVEVLKAITL